MRIILDTSAYSLFIRGSTAATTVIQEADQIIFNPVVLGELYAGFIKGGGLQSNRAKLKAFLSSHRVMVVDIDGETAEMYALIHNDLRRAGTPIPSNDIWIAASAMQHGLRLVTMDAHFDKVTQVLVEQLPL